MLSATSTAPPPSSAPTIADQIHPRHKPPVIVAIAGLSLHTASPRLSDALPNKGRGQAASRNYPMDPSRKSRQSPSIPPPCPEPNLTLVSALQSGKGVGEKLMTKSDCTGSVASRHPVKMPRTHRCSRYTTDAALFGAGIGLYLSSKVFVCSSVYIERTSEQTIDTTAAKIHQG